MPTIYYDLFTSPNITGVTKLRKMRWADHVVRTGRGELHTAF